MKTPVIAAVAVGALLLCSADAHAAEKRILLAGDCWLHYQEDFGSYDNWLQENGYSAYETVGDLTAVRGLTARMAASDVICILPYLTFLDMLDQELDANPTIDIVHLLVGGNDYFVPFGVPPDYLEWNAMTPAELDYWLGTYAVPLATVIQHIRDNYPQIKITLSSYLYLDLELVSYAWSIQFQMTQAEFNYWFATFMDIAKNIAAETDHVDFVNNWGLFQYHHGVPGRHDPYTLPFPGQRFDFDPYLGGDPQWPEAPYTVPGGESLWMDNDGFHPSDLGHRLIFANCVDQFYDAWLTDVTPPNAVSIERDPAAPNPTTTPTVDFIVKFDEEVRKPDVTPDRFAATGPAKALSVVSVSGGGDTYVVTVDAGTVPGEIGLDLVDAAGIRDIAYHSVTSALSGSETYSFLGPDSDGDGLMDSEEALLGTDPLKEDTDDDGLSDYDEVNGTFGHITDPLLRDTDGDGYGDGFEVMMGVDPTNPVAELKASGWRAALCTALLLALVGIAIIPRKKTAGR